MRDHAAENPPLVRILRQLGQWPATVVLLIGMAVWCCVDVAPRADVRPGHMHRTDLTVYTEAGAAFFDGRDPYAVASPRGWHYLYPPLFAILIAPLASLEPTIQATIWFGVSVLLCCGCFMECRRLINLGLKEDNESRSASSVTVIAAFTWLAAAFPVLNTLQRGQVGVAVLYPLLLGYRLVLSQQRGAKLFGGTILALPVALKLTPALPVGVVLMQRFAVSQSARRAQKRSLATAPAAGLLLGLFLFFCLIPSAFVGWTSNARHLQT